MSVIQGSVQIIPSESKHGSLALTFFLPQKRSLVNFSIFCSGVPAVGTISPVRRSMVPQPDTGHSSPVRLIRFIRGSCLLNFSWYLQSCISSSAVSDPTMDCKGEGENNTHSMGWKIRNIRGNNKARKGAVAEQLLHGHFQSVSSFNLLLILTFYFAGK